MASLKSPIEDLLIWASGHGTELDPRVEIYHDERTGLSFKARAEVPPNTPFAVSSPSTTLSYLNALEYLGYSSHSPPFPPEFISGLGSSYCHIIGHFFLVQQYLMGSVSFWYPYIRTLPQPNSPGGIPTPVGWTTADLCFLADTNAGKAVDEKLKILRSDFMRGFNLLRGWPNVDFYTWDLYLWAAMIFGTRSFRPSLTTSLNWLSLYTYTSNPWFKPQNSLALLYVQKDNFSILHPVVDIGNHNGENRVQWMVNSIHQFEIITTAPVEKGAQLYNYYGPKTNSELLVGYGFVLDKPELDVVYVSLRPPPEFRALRRGQACHSVRTTSLKEEEEWRFEVFHVPVAGGHGRPGYGYFEHGLLETISCIVSNDRERRFLIANPGYCLEKDFELNSFNMSRNIIAAYQVLHEKLQVDLQKLRISDANLVPKNPNQVLASRYRRWQIDTLEAAALPFTSIFEGLLQHNTFCNHDMHSHKRPSDNPKVAGLLESVEILPLECAYDWLSHKFPEIYGPLASLVSQIEEEPNPPRWNVLAKDFGYVYWTIWLFIVLTLHVDDSTVLAACPDLRKWMDMITSSFLKKLEENDSFGPVDIDRQEQETIVGIINALLNYPELQKRHARSLDPVSIRALAASVAFQETIVLPLKDDQVEMTGAMPQGNDLPSNHQKGNEEAAQINDLEAEGEEKETRTHLVLCIPKDVFEVFPNSDGGDDNDDEK